MPSPVLMFMNMKGGVGKTTLAVEISRTLAYKYDKEVLLIDYDPQANASFAFLRPKQYFENLNIGRSLANCLMPSHSDADPFAVVGTAPPDVIDVRDYSVRVRRWRYKRNPEKKAGSLHLIPGALSMMRIALNVLESHTEKLLLERWNALIDDARKSFECVVVDCHPAGSFFTKSALLASDAVVIPVTSDAYAATGLNMMRQHMRDWESSGGAKEYLVLFNDTQNAWDNAMEARIRRRFAKNCLSTRVSYSSLLRNLAKRHQTAAEQPVAYKRRVGAHISDVTEELVDLLRERSVLDSSW